MRGIHKISYTVIQNKVLTPPPPSTTSNLKVNILVPIAGFLDISFWVPLWALFAAAAGFPSDCFIHIFT
jgi:hypothetical protein